MTKATQGTFQGHGTELSKSMSHSVNLGSALAGRCSCSASQLPHMASTGWAKPWDYEWSRSTSYSSELHVHTGPVDNCSSHLTSDFFCTISRYRAGTAAITDSPNTVQGLPRCWGLSLLPLDEGCMILNLKHFQNLLKPCTGFALIGSYQKLSVTDTYDPKPYFGPSRVIWRLRCTFPSFTCSFQ